MRKMLVPLPFPEGTSENVTNCTGYLFAGMTDHGVTFALIGEMDEHDVGRLFHAIFFSRKNVHRKSLRRIALLSAWWHITGKILEIDGGGESNA